LGELDEFLGLEEGFKMLHLPGAHYHQDHSLSQSPPASNEIKVKLKQKNIIKYFKSGSHLYGSPGFGSSGDETNIKLELFKQFLNGFIYYLGMFRTIHFSFKDTKAKKKILEKRQ
jgi:hypothetical protein